MRPGTRRPGVFTAGVWQVSTANSISLLEDVVLPVMCIARTHFRNFARTGQRRTPVSKRLYLGSRAYPNHCLRDTFFKFCDKRPIAHETAIRTDVASSALAMDVKPST